MKKMIAVAFVMAMALVACSKKKDPAMAKPTPTTETKADEAAPPADQAAAPADPAKPADPCAGKK